MKRHSVTHEGFTFTRRSGARTYTHAVLARESIKRDRELAERYAREYWHRNRPLHIERASTSDESCEWLAKGEEGHVAESLSRFDQQTRRQTMPDGDTYFVVAGWATRLDLAEKLARKVGAGAVIVPTSDVFEA